jgi:hypothetical protein
MMNTFSLYAALSPFTCAFVGACVAYGEKAGGWTILLFTVAGLVLGGAAGAYSLQMEQWLIKSKRPTSSKWTLAYPVCSFLGIALLTGLLTFWLVGFTL